MTDLKESTIVDHVVKFQHEDQKKLQLVLLCQIAVIVSLIGFIIVDWNKKPEPVIFVTTVNEQLINAVDVKMANLNHAAVLNWFTEAIMNSYRYNYKNLDEKLNSAKQYYTESGFTEFKKSLGSHPVLGSIVDTKYIVSMRVLKAPEVLQDQVVNGVYAWNIRLPIRVYVQNQVIPVQAMNLDIETIVVRVPETESPIGLKIDAFVANDLLGRVR